MTSMKTTWALALLITITAGSNSFAKSQSTLAPGEPAFCDVNTLKKVELDVAAPGLNRTHAYQIGDLTLVGMGVGKSDVAATKALAAKFSNFAPEEKNCTWYFNDGNDAAAEAFNHHYITSPIFKGTKVAAEYEKVLAGIFADDAVSMLSCALNRGYLAMGCDGMKHRGPSVFAMTLAFAGCSAVNATKIANKVWGNNFVPTKTREAIADKGRILGDKNPAARRAFQSIMGTNP